MDLETAFVTKHSWKEAEDTARQDNDIWQGQRTSPKQNDWKGRMEWKIIWMAFLHFKEARAESHWGAAYVMDTWLTKYFNCW